LRQPLAIRCASWRGQRADEDGGQRAVVLSGDELVNCAVVTVTATTAKT
jgi:hypothetical protein